ncbi:class I SAM-dependent methyltransferase [Cyanobium sp. ATX 6A2]|uniref:class I SAM-dependent methyltransferase n=1 Tax=Cyanobium sp. ATX 6A2 TaxID=2823700 RepID=UPI0020CBDF2A|nr:class I SAM-dependent methyltransferase [Cyanobium sp. ATX 6A2]MCP9889147.1 class I SAM-dependent methyltransferase [Cyanobium sp. ATX 6A2]
MDPETVRELDLLKRLASKYAWSDQEARAYIESGNDGVCIRKPHFYSSLPTIEDINSSFEYDSDGNSLPLFSPDRYCLAEQLKLLSDINEEIPYDLESFCSETGFQWANGQFDRSDAVHYYGFLRKYKPKTVVEVGSGWSSRIAASAMAGSGRLVCIDPAPRADISKLDIEIIETKIQECDPAEISASVADGDVLFIDSSHALKTGNDCVFVYCILFPLLRPGVIVQIHDLYLPHGRPRPHLVNQRLYWYEDYLVQVLVSTGRLKPLLANNFIGKSGFASKFMPTPNGVGGASIWFKVC